jgi:protocatechuate 3,4-dioxygenase beta subunit
MMKRPCFIWIGLAIPILSSSYLPGSPTEQVSEGLGNTASAAFEVRGRVVDEAGAPVMGARVELHRLLPRFERSLEVLQGFIHPESEVRVKTSADGGYALTVPQPGMWQVEISAKGKVPLRRQLVPLLESGLLPQARLMEDAGVELRVVDSEGAPVAGAQAWISPLLDDMESHRRHRQAWEERGRFGLTDEEGRVRLSRRVDDSVEAFAYAEGFMPSRAVKVEGSPATIRLAQGQPQEIQFLTAAGDPVVGALVDIGEQLWMAASTDEEGRALVFLLPGRAVAFGLTTAEGRRESGSLEGSSEEVADGPVKAEEMTLPEPVFLEGRVIEADSREAAFGVWVWSPLDPGGAVRTDRAGYYRLLQGSGRRWRIAAQGPGYQQATDTATMEGADLRVPTLALTRGGDLAGRVVDPEGLGVSWAELIARPAAGRAGRGREFPRSWTDDKGRFSLSGLSESATYDLVVQADGFATARRVVRPSDKDYLEIVLDAGRTLIGRLVSRDGGAVAGAEITVAPTAEGWIRMQYDLRQDTVVLLASSDAEGRFRVENLPDGPLGLVAVRKGFAKKQVPNLDVTGFERILDVGELLMVPGSILEGVVNEKGGVAIAGAEVRLQRESFAAYSLAQILWSVAGDEQRITDDTGRFVIDDLNRGESLSLSVEHPGFITYHSGSMQPGAGRVIEIFLERAARVSGRVETERGEPVLGVTVEAIGRRTAGKGFAEHPHRSLVRDQARSSEDGSFTLTEVWPGKVEVTAEGAGRISTEPVSLSLTAGEERSGVVIRMRQGSELSGTVTDTGGRPVAGAHLRISQRKLRLFSSSRFGVASGQTDAEGRYSIEGLDTEIDDLALSVVHEDYPPLERTLELEPGSNRLDITLETGVSVTGFVLTQGGEPVSGASVGLEGDHAMFHRGDNTLTMADGSFELSGVAPGTYEVVAVKESFARAVSEEPIEVGADLGVRGVTVYLSRGGTISGRILGLEPEELPELQIFASDDQSGFAMGVVDESGEYRVSNVGFDEGTVSAASRAHGQHVSESFALDTDGGETWIDLEFRQEGSVLTGSVFLDGKPWPGAGIYVLGGTESGGSAITNSAGRFEVRGLRDGPHEISVHDNGSTAASRQVEVAGSTDFVIEITSVRISGRVENATTGEPVSGALILVRDDSSTFGFMSSGTQTETRHSGEFDLLLPADHTVTLEARAEGFTQASISFETGPGGEITDLELELEPAGELELDVRLASGVRPNSVSVGVIDSAGNVVYVDTLHAALDWPYRLRSVPDGDWNLLVGADGGATLSVPISVPGPPVSVTLPAEAVIIVKLGAVTEGSEVATLRLISPSGEPFRFLTWYQILTEWPVRGTRFALTSIPAGEWLVEVLDSSGRVWHQGVTTLAGQTTDVVIE